MSIIVYSDADGFLKHAQDWLERREAINNLLLGVALRLRQYPERINTPPYCATVDDAQGVAAAAVMTPPYRVIVYTDRPDPAKALEPIVEDLCRREQSVPGVIAPAPVAAAMAELWGARTARAVRAGRQERGYELRQVNALPPVPGRLRPARTSDQALITEWAYAFHADIGQELNRAGVEESVAYQIADGTLHVWEDERVVSMCNAMRPITHGISVGLVYTPPAFRRRGYARAAVAALSQALLDSGWQFCTLFTDLANPTSNHIYQEIGYTPVCDYREYDFT